MKEKTTAKLLADKFMDEKWRIKANASYSSPGEVKTGREWFNIYMIFPWERDSDFELVVE